MFCSVGKSDKKSDSTQVQHTFTKSNICKAWIWLTMQKAFVVWIWAAAALGRAFFLQPSCLPAALLSNRSLKVFCSWRAGAQWSQLYILCKFVPSIVSPRSQIHTVNTPRGFISLPLVLSLLSSDCVYFSIIPQCFNFSNFLFIYFYILPLCAFFPICGLLHH